MSNEQIAELVEKDYAAGFVTDIESITLPPWAKRRCCHAYLKGKKRTPMDARLAA